MMNLGAVDEQRELHSLGQYLKLERKMDFRAQFFVEGGSAWICSFRDFLW